MLHKLRKVRINRSRSKKKHKLRLITVAQWVNNWYSIYKETKHALTTRQVQKVYIDLHIIPQLGHLFMHKVTAEDIQKFINHLRTSGNLTKLKHNRTAGRGLSAWTVKKIRALLLAAFDAAVKEKIILENPVKDTETIAVKTLNITYFTPEQEEKFLTYTKNHRFYLAYKLLFNTGCRRSEILGLSWDCVDLYRHQIHIKNVLVTVDGKPFLKNYPKSKASVRTIPLHPVLSAKLKKHKAKQLKEERSCEGWNNEYNLVFTNSDGSPHNPTYFLRNFKNVVKKLGLPKHLRVHSTRHTFATNLFQLNTSIPDVQVLGGWADTRVVLEIYAHSAPDSHRNTMKKLYERNK